MGDARTNSRTYRPFMDLAFPISKPITLSIGPDHGLFTFPAGAGISVFHAHDAGIPFLVDVPKDVLIIDLSGGGFLSARVVPYLEIGDLLPRGIDIGNQVAFLDLLVVNVEKDLAGRTVHGLADLEGLGALGEEESGMVAEVQRFQHHDQIMGLQKG